MLVIPFPVCEYAANHCREGRRLGNISNYIEGTRLKNKRKEKKRKKKKEKRKRFICGCLYNFMS